VPLSARALNFGFGRGERMSAKLLLSTGFRRVAGSASRRPPARDLHLRHFDAGDCNFDVAKGSCAPTLAGVDGYELGHCRGNIGGALCQASPGIFHSSPNIANAWLLKARRTGDRLGPAAIPRNSTNSVAYRLTSRCTAFCTEGETRKPLCRVVCRLAGLSARAKLPVADSGKRGRVGRRPQPVTLLRRP
jgi:hypothetical protein